MALVVISVALLVFAVFFSVDSIVEIHDVQQRLSDDPSASGIDFLGSGWLHGAILFCMAVVGSVVCGINIKISRCGMIKNISAFLLLSFLILILVAVFIFYQ